MVKQERSTPDDDYEAQVLKNVPEKAKRKSAAGRKLMRWAPDVDQLVLLAIDHICVKQGIPLPWDEVAKEVEEYLTGEAIKQHLTKIRAARVEAGQKVPEKLAKQERRKCVSTKATTPGRSAEAEERNNTKVSSLVYVRPQKQKKPRAAAKGRKARADNDANAASVTPPYTPGKTGISKRTRKPTAKSAYSALLDDEEDDDEDEFASPVKPQKVPKLRAQVPIDYKEEIDEEDFNEEEEDKIEDVATNKKRAPSKPKAEKGGSQLDFSTRGSGPAAMKDEDEDYHLIDIGDGSDFGNNFMTPPSTGNFHRGGGSNVYPSFDKNQNYSISSIEGNDGAFHDEAFHFNGHGHPQPRMFSSAGSSLTQMQASPNAGLGIMTGVGILGGGGVHGHPMVSNASSANMHSMTFSSPNNAPFHGEDFGSFHVAQSSGGNPGVPSPYHAHPLNTNLFDGGLIGQPHSASSSFGSVTDMDAAALGHTVTNASAHSAPRFLPPGLDMTLSPTDDQGGYHSEDHFAVPHHFARRFENGPGNDNLDDVMATFDPAFHFA